MKNRKRVKRTGNWRRILAGAIACWMIAGMVMEPLNVAAAGNEAQLTAMSKDSDAVQTFTLTGDGDSAVHTFAMAEDGNTDCAPEDADGTAANTDETPAGEAGGADDQDLGEDAASGDAESDDTKEPDGSEDAGDESDDADPVAEDASEETDTEDEDDLLTLDEWETDGIESVYAANVNSSPYKLIVGGVPVTEENRLDITGPNITGEVFYNASYRTLYIKDATITGGTDEDSDRYYGAAIYSGNPDGITIDISGTCNVKMGGKNEPADLRAAMYTVGETIIKDSGTLNIGYEGGFSAANTAHAIGIYSRGSVTMKDSITVNINTPDARVYNHGIYVESDGVDGLFLMNGKGLTINTGIVNADAGDVYSQTYGIEADDIEIGYYAGNLNITAGNVRTESDTVKKASYGLCARNDFEMESGTVTATAGEITNRKANSNVAGIYAGNSINVKDGTLTADGNEKNTVPASVTGVTAYGLKAHSSASTINISSSNCTIKGHTAALGCNNFKDDAVDVVFVESVSPNYSGEPKYTSYDVAKIRDYKYIKTGIKEYNLWIAGRQVVSNYANNIDGGGIEGHVSYDAVTNTLTLENATIDSNNKAAMSVQDSVGIYSNDDAPLTIKLIGENEINNASGFNKTAYGIYKAKGNLTITGDGTLTIVSELQSLNDNYGIYCANDLTIESGTIKVTAKDATNNSEGIYVKKNFTVKGGKIECVAGTAGNTYGIYVSETMSVEDGDISARIIGGSNKCSGIYASNFTVSGGSVIAAADKTVTNGYGVEFDQNFNITSGARVKALGLKQAISGIPTLEDYSVAINDKMQLKASEKYDYTLTDIVEYKAADRDKYKYVYAGPVSYGLYVGGVEVTKYNYKNIQGENIEGLVSFDPDNNILNLKNATIKGEYNDGDTMARGILWNNTENDLTISLTGDNLVKGARFKTGEKDEVVCIESIYKGITFTGSGTLNLPDYNAMYQQNNDIGIWATNGIVTVDSGTINIRHSQYGNDSIGIDAKGLTINGGKTDVHVGMGNSGNAFAVKIGSSGLTMTGGTLTAIAQSCYSSKTAAGIFINAPINMTGGTLIAKGEDYAILGGILNYGTLTAQASKELDGELADYKDGDKSDYKYIRVDKTTRTDYKLWVGGVQVTSDNCDDITGGGIYSGKASYDPAKKILRLNDASIYGKDDETCNGAAIYYGDTSNLTIEYENGAYISGRVYEYLDDDGDVKSTSYGIYSEGGLTLKQIDDSDKELSVYINDKANVTIAIYAKKDISIYGLVNAYFYDYIDKGAGIYSETGSINIIGGDVKAVGKEGSGANKKGSSYGIYAGNAIYIKDDSKVGGEAGYSAEDNTYGIYAQNTINITDSTVGAYGGLTGKGDSIGMYAGKDITIDAGEDGGIYAAGAAWGFGGNSIGLYTANKKLTINSGYILICGGTYAVNVNPVLTKYKNAKFQVYYDKTDYDYNSPAEYEASKITEYGYMTIEPPAPPEPEYYGISIGYDQITSENASNFKSDYIKSGTVSYDAATNTLKLNNVVIDRGESGWYALSLYTDGLTVELTGNNKIMGGESEVIYNSRPFTIKEAPGKSGSLYILQNNSEPYSSYCYAIYSAGNTDTDKPADITIESGTVYAMDDLFAEYSGERAGLKFDYGGKLIVNGGTFVASSPGQAILGKLDIKDGMTAKAGTNKDGVSLLPYDASKLSNYMYIKVTDVKESEHVHNNLVRIEGKDATCTEAGVATYYICSCGSYFKDAAGIQEIPATAISEYKTIEPLGHNAVIKSDDKGHWSVCSVCGDMLSAKAAHSFDEYNACRNCTYAKGLRITLESEKYTYTGSAIKPGMQVTCYDKVLTEGVDYKVTYKNNVKAYNLVEGNNGYQASKAPTITVKGIGTYSGTVSDTFVINPVHIGYTTRSGVTVVKGSKATPILTFNGMKLTSADYTNPDANTKFTENTTVKLTGKGNFTGEIYYDVKVVENKKDIKKFNVTLGKEKLVYDGTYKKISYTVRDASTKAVLRENWDYYVEYNTKDFISAGTVKITFVGMGEYTGVDTKSYTIKPMTAPNGSMLATGINSAGYTYDINGVTPDITVTYRGNGTEKVLKKDADYTLSYSGHNKAGKAKYTVKFTGNYKGTKNISADYIIRPATLTDTTPGLNISVADMAYTGKAGAYKSTPIVAIDGTILKTSEYTVAYYTDAGLTKTVGGKNTIKLGDDNKPVPVYVKITGKGNFNANDSGRLFATATYYVKPAPAGTIDLSKARITFNENKTATATNKAKTSFEYTGRQVMPSVKVEVQIDGEWKNISWFEDGKEIYDWEFYNNISKGKATVVIKSMPGSNCIGSKTATFTITTKDMKNSIWRIFRF